MGHVHYQCNPATRTLQCLDLRGRILHGRRCATKLADQLPEACIVMLQLGIFSFQQPKVGLELGDPGGLALDGGLRDIDALHALCVQNTYPWPRRARCGQQARAVKGFVR